jgi:iron complex outermembrane receptor protein
MELPAVTVEAPKRRIVTPRRAPARRAGRTAATAAAPAAAPSTRAPESAWGPVVGYRATRSGSGTWTDTPLKDIPQSIQVVPRQVIQDQQASSLVDVLDNVSNVSQLSQNGGRASTFTIRGFDVRNYKIDGLTLNQTQISAETNLDPAWIERVEVLKGPSAVLYGDGYYGGSVNVVTRRPSLIPGADATLRYGSFDRMRGEFSVTGPVTTVDNLAFRLTGAVQKEGAWRDIASDSKRQFIAPALLWTPTADTKVWFNAAYTHQTAPVDFGLIAVRNQILKPYTRFLGEPWAQQEGSVGYVNYGAEHRFNDWLQVRFRGNATDGEAHRMRAPAGALNLATGVLARRAADQYDTSYSSNNVLDAVLDFNTGWMKHQVMVGVEYQNGYRSVTLNQATLAGINIYNPVYGAMPGKWSLQSINRNRIETKSAFIQDQIDLTSQLKLLAGVRYDYATSFDHNTNNKYVDTRSSDDTARATPRIGLVYQPIDWLSLYASYSQGFQAQGGFSRTGERFKPETGDQYEVGAKFDLIPNNLSATVSAFRIIRQGVLTTDPVDTNFSIQTGEQRSQGVELDITGNITPNWNVIASAAYTDATITKDNVFPVGNRLFNVPRMSGALWSTYKVTEGTFSGFTFGGGFVAQGDRYPDLYNTAIMPGYIRFDGMVSYNINDNLKLTFSMKNIFDTKYIRSAQSNSLTEIYPGDPRTAMLSISGKL